MRLFFAQFRGGTPLFAGCALIQARTLRSFMDGFGRNDADNRFLYDDFFLGFMA
jgi:hypothetical protein